MDEIHTYVCTCIHHIREKFQGRKVLLFLGFYENHKSCNIKYCSWLSLNINSLHGTWCCKCENFHTFYRKTAIKYEEFIILFFEYYYYCCKYWPRFALNWDYCVQKWDPYLYNLFQFSAKGVRIYIAIFLCWLYFQAMQPQNLPPLKL